MYLTKGIGALPLFIALSCMLVSSVVLAQGRVQAVRAVRAQLNPQANALSVMTFNILASSLKRKGCASWQERRSSVARAILKHSPDIVGIQEATPVQMHDLDISLTGYASVRGKGAKRRGGKGKYESTPIYYKKSRFTKVLDRNGSYKSSKGLIPQERVWNVVQLRDRKSQRHYLVVNTHWESRHSRYRNRAAKELVNILRQLRVTFPYDTIFVIGDFNARYQNNHKDKAIKTLLTGFPLMESHCSQHQTNEGTANKKCSGRSDGKRIDHIFFSAPAMSPFNLTHWPATNAQKLAAVDAQCRKRFGQVKQVVVDKSPQGRTRRGKPMYPSDHFPVVTKFVLDPQTKR